MASQNVTKVAPKLTVAEKPQIEKSQVEKTELAKLPEPSVVRSVNSQPTPSASVTPQLQITPEATPIPQPQVTSEAKVTPQPQQVNPLNSTQPTTTSTQANSNVPVRFNNKRLTDLLSQTRGNVSQANNNDKPINSNSREGSNNNNAGTGNNNLNTSGIGNSKESGRGLGIGIGNGSGNGSGNGAGNGSGNGLGNGSGNGTNTNDNINNKPPEKTTVATAPKPPNPEYGSKLDPADCQECIIEYPERSRRRKIEGSPEVSIDVDENGKVTNARLNRSSGSQELDEALLEQARKFKLKPSARVSQGVRVSANFVIDGSQRHQELQQRKRKRGKKN
ncbi:hypothetical protein NIES4071_21700 [Calothrix sp. NIES-4071]|nr:hypothetical protein NIES4071_21700 [Calothrix sp. NIES-4071]BAZ56502.1 hypothetical protein NIES4105_21650 [Calothrix sp. NIES-4105]